MEDLWLKLETALIQGAVILIPAVSGFVIWWLDSKKVAKRVEAVRLEAREAAANVSEVKTTLEDTSAQTIKTLDEIAQVGKDTHTLVNSAMGSQKRLLAVTARALADRDPNPINIKAAEVAEEEYRQHQVKQARVDDANA